MQQMTGLQWVRQCNSLVALPVAQASCASAACVRLSQTTTPLTCKSLLHAGGLQEVQRLEKLRQKRAFEASLPPIDDAARLPERQALIEAWEAAEWAEREGEIQGVQDERLALLQAALKVRACADLSSVSARA